MTSTLATTMTGGWSESAESLLFFRGKEADDGHQSTDDSGAAGTPREEEPWRRLKPTNFAVDQLQLCAVESTFSLLLVPSDAF